MTRQSRFWVYDWLDSHRIENLSTAKRALASRSAVDQIHDFAEKAKTAPATCGEDTYSIVAGRGLDLSGHLDCNASECRIRQVDDLFSHAWHYFDRIVVADGMSHEVSMHWDAPLAARKKWLLSHIEVLLYLRKIGAQDLVVFSEKPPPCEVHWEKHAHEQRLDTLLAVREKLVDQLSTEARIETKKGADGALEFAFVHPRFEHSVWGSLGPEDLVDRSKTGIARAVSVAVLRRYLAHLTSDVATIKHFEVPLGSTVWFHGELLKNLSKTASTSEIAFALDLPVLRGLPVETLLKIRSDEREAFVRFRNHLHQAISERAKTAGNTAASKLAAEIRRDLIDPELETIRQRLHSAEQMLGKKAAVGIVLGGLATVCGLIAGVPPPLATAAGVATLTTVAGTAAAKDIEERRDVSLSGMYFLWKAAQHASHKRAA